MTSPAGILERIDRIAAELAALRDEVAASQNAPANEAGHGDGLADDLAAENLLDTSAAQERFGYPRNSLARMCREEGLGVRQGGRWMVSVPRMQKRLNGG